MSRTDLNKAAETILIPLLNEVYSWRLENINYAEDNPNYPGIDLADEAAKISIQVTATPGLEKVKQTLEQFAKHNQYLKYNRLVIYILKKRQNSYSEKTIQRITQNKFSFDSQKDIWDCRDILKEVSNLQIDKALRVQEILEENFGGGKHLSAVGGLENKINWRKTCRELLSHWKGLTTNALTTPNGVRFQLDEIFVPLGVVERQKKPTHRLDVDFSERGSELYKEKVTPIGQNEFFEQVLSQQQSKNSQGRRIAIIGEPGAGKTTQLQKVGDWILEEIDGIPIWIPLAAVGTKTLREYLLNDWLQTATQELEVSQQHREELGRLLKTGEVWLLLDGVDEMAIPDALHQIATQMCEGWLRNVRVVLTCRLNVWDAGKNALDGFDVYRNLDFDYPTEVHEFIDNWFATEPALQQKLKIALEQPGKERVRDMVKNPLRLTLLCYSWQLRQGELPETKAGLYEWFVDAFYEWNKGKVPKLNATKREELNRALGELAKEAIDQESSRFRLPKKFINRFLGDFDNEDSLFCLALQLGWLNRIGVAEENPLEDVYAFFHPTFQEYFAALAIEDWNYFLPSEHKNKPIENKRYRIFEPSWKEIILLWMGRGDVDYIFRGIFLKKLVDMRDSCDFFYWYKSYFLAAAITTEYIETNNKGILENLSHMYFNYFDEKQKTWKGFADCIRNDAKIALLESNRLEVVKALTDKLDNPTEWFRLKIAKFLEEIDPGNQTVSKTLFALIRSNSSSISFESIEVVCKAFSNQQLIEFLYSKTQVDQPERIRLEAARILANLYPCEERVIIILLELFQQTYSDSIRIDVVEHVKQLAQISLKLNELLKDFLISKSNLQKTWLAAHILGQSEPKSLKLSIDRLIYILRYHKNNFSPYSAIRSLGLIARNDLSAIHALTSEIKNPFDEWSYYFACDSLGRISTENHSDVIESLICLLEKTNDGNLIWSIAESLGRFGKNNSKAINVLHEIIGLVKDKNILQVASISLGRIGGRQEKRKALQVLVNLLNQEIDIFPGSWIADGIKELLDKSFMDAIVMELKPLSTEAAFDVLWHCAQNMSYPDFYRAWHSSSSADVEMLE